MKGFDVTNKKYRGLNAFSEVTSLTQGDLRQATNVDLYYGDKNDSIQSRRGSAVLGGTAYGAGVKNDTVFAVGDDEHLITQVGEAFYSQKVSPTVGNPVRIHSSVLTMTGTGNPLSDPVLNGLTLSNTNEYTLYFSVGKGSGLYGLLLFKDVGMSQIVAFGTIPDSTPLPALITVAQESGSGISGTIQLNVDPTTTPKTGTIAYNPWGAGSDTNDIKNANQKIFCFSQEGNSVISWNADESRFMARPMGLVAPIIETIVEGLPVGQIPENSSFYYGLEKLIRKNGGDLVASSPNRKTEDGILAFVHVANPSGAVDIEVLASSITADPYWTHLRLWRSKSTIPDFSDPLFPLDAQGLPSQLYEVAVITREEVYGGFGNISTGAGLPPGNAGVAAGFGGGAYLIQDKNDDSVLVDFVDLDRIDLVPIPPARTGAVHAGRVFVSGINQADIDPDLAEDVLYTTEVYSAYQEQWDAQAFLNAGRNSFKTTMLQSFNDDLLIIREGETKRIPSGNVDAGIQMVDDRIGVQTFLMAGFVTGLGIAAVCSDRYFRYLGFDYRWHSTLSKIDASNAIYPFTKVQSATAASFGYINGKLMMLLIDLEEQADYGFFVLHVKEGHGWTKYDYLVDDIVCLFNFSDGLRAGIIPAESVAMEIEAETDTDWDGAGLIKVAGTTEFAPVMAESGMLDVSQFSFWGKLTKNAEVTAKSSGIDWQMLPTFQQPGLWEAESTLNEREYIFKPQPQTVGVFKWVPLRGQFISFALNTSGQFFLSWNRTQGSIRETLGNLGVFQSGGIIPQGPGWASPSLVLLNFEDPGETFYDASGKQNNLEWSGVGTKTNRITQKPGKGLQILSSGDPRTSPMTDGSEGSLTTDFASLIFTSLGFGSNSVVAGETVFIRYEDIGSQQRIFTVYRDADGGPVDLMSGTTTGSSPQTVTLSPQGTGAPSGTVEQIAYTDDNGNGTAAVVFGDELPVVLDRATDVASDAIGTKNLTFKAVVYIEANSYFLISGSDKWSLYIGTDKTEFVSQGTAYSSIAVQPETVYVVIFVLGKDGSGQFYIDTLSHFSGKQPTEKASGGGVSVSGMEASLNGRISYFEIEATKYTDQQAKRFWGIVKAY